MKKIIIITGFIFISLNIAFASYIRITKNGGSKGYNTTRLTVDKKGNTIIKCSKAGYEPAPRYTTDTKQSEKDLVDYAIEQILKGVLKGSYEKNGEKLTWISDTKEMINSTITIK